MKYEYIIARCFSLFASGLSLVVALVYGETMGYITSALGVVAAVVATAVEAHNRAVTFTEN